ncbi:SDR family NAD(P)-dependent oxidoreductase [Bizionia sediminis]|uniref:SDR family NAD(P)-dependent oxidoreductase n=1 Tax=Bizionia sediminis TaxID=1737064 RepID=A0ABW5KQD9_9FLAO
MKTYIIIGGSKGIGLAITKNLLEQHEVINLSRTAPEIEHRNLTHYNVDILEDNLPDLEQADGLIYCPGSINLKPVGRLKLDDFRSDFEINVIGAVKAMQKYLPVLKKGDKPAMLFFSTVATKLGMPFHASVAAAKSAVEGLVKSVGAELAPTVRVNAIAPTVTDTSLAANLLRNDKMVENMTERHPLKKFLNPTEVAQMAAFLLSDQAASISGQIFEMDCGIVSFKL